MPGAEVEVRAWSGTDAGTKWSIFKVSSGADGAFDVSIDRALATRGFGVATTAEGFVEGWRAVKAGEYDEGVGVDGVGEMGIGNTTSASALAAALLPAEPSSVCGPGTGIDDGGLSRKVDAVRRGLIMLSLEPDPDPKRPSNARIAIWIVVGAIGLYLLGSGIWGIITDG